MSSNIIFPTNTCFDDTVEFIAQKLCNATTAEVLVLIEELILVHAICASPEGRLYSHAWIEQGEWCYERGILEEEAIYYALEKAEHYAKRDVQEKFVYSLEEVFKLNEKYGNSGPWEPALQALCRRSK